MRANSLPPMIWLCKRTFHYRNCVVVSTFGKKANGLLKLRRWFAGNSFVPVPEKFLG